MVVFGVCLFYCGFWCYSGFMNGFWGKLVDFGSQVTSVFLLSQCLDVGCVCSSLVDLGVHAIDSSLPMSNLFF